MRLAYGQGISVIRDAETEELLRDLLEPLLHVGGITPQSIRIHIIVDDTLNAFVTQGQQLFLHTGLLARVETADQLTGVLAHEVGHMVSGHTLRLKEAIGDASLIRTLTTLLALPAAIGAGTSEGALAVMLGSQHALENSLRKFTREFEVEADRYALGTLDRLGLSAQGFLDFMRILDNNSQTQLSNLTVPYEETHPLTKDRIRKAQKHIRSSSAKNTILPELTKRFHRVQRKLIGYFQPNRVLRDSRTEQGVDPLAARYGEATALFRDGQSQAALLIMDDLIAREPDNAYFHELAAEIAFRGGQGDRARKHIGEVLRRKPDEPLISLLAAHILSETSRGKSEDLRDVLTLARRVVRNEPDNASAWRLISSAHARIGNHGQAALANAERLFALGDWHNARKIAGQAINILPSASHDSYRARQIIIEADTKSRH